MGYANAPMAMETHFQSQQQAKMVDHTVLPAGVSRLREAINADSIIRANHCSSESGPKKLVPEVYEIPLSESVLDSSKSAFEMSTDELAHVFTLIADGDSANTLIDSVPATNDFVNLELLVADSPEYHAFWENPLQPNQNAWDYSIFPGTGIEVYQSEFTPLGAAMQLPSVQHTCNAIQVDPTFDLEIDYSTFEVVFQSDDKGRVMPMATAYCLVKSVNNFRCNRFLKCLFDTGGSKSMAHRSVVPSHVPLQPAPGSTLCNTIAGNYQPVGLITLEDMRFPEFTSNLSVDKHDFLVFEPKCTFDLILGNDFLTKIGLKIDLGNLELEWLGNKMPMNSRFTQERLSAAVDCCLIEEEEEDLQNYLACFAVALDESKYEEMHVNQAIRENCTHLDTGQQNDLRSLLFEHYNLFDGTLHTYKGEKMDVELEEGARSVFRRPYPTPRVHLETFKTELLRLADIGVLEKIPGPSA